MPKGFYKRSKEHLEKLREQAHEMRKYIQHGKNCNCVACISQRNPPIGKKNPRWKDGKWQGWINHEKARERKAVLGNACQNCGSKRYLDVHHKDCDFANNALTNLVLLCRHCHMATHKETKK